MSNVPSQTLAALCGSRISAAHFPHGLCLTPLYLLLRSPPVSSRDAVSLDGVVGVPAVVGVVVVAVVVIAVGSTKAEGLASSIAAN